MVGAALLPGIPKTVAKDIFTRISDSLVASRVGPTVGRGMKMAFDVYGKSLLAEAANPNENIGFADGGQTAKIMFDLLSESYARAEAFESSPPLKISPLESTELRILIDAAIVGQFKAFVEMNLRYVQ